MFVHLIKSLRFWANCSLLLAFPSAFWHLLLQACGQFCGHVLVWIWIRVSSEKGIEDLSKFLLFSLESPSLFELSLVKVHRKTQFLSVLDKLVCNLLFFFVILQFQHQCRWFITIRGLRHVEVKLTFFLLESSHESVVMFTWLSAGLALFFSFHYILFSSNGKLLLIWVSAEDALHSTLLLFVLFGESLSCSIDFLSYSLFMFPHHWWILSYLFGNWFLLWWFIQLLW